MVRAMVHSKGHGAQLGLWCTVRVMVHSEGYDTRCGAQLDRGSC